MQFTKAEGYGILGLLYLAAKEPDEIVPLSEIAEAENVPEKFLAKIFQNLTKTGIITSHRGVKGGFSINRAPKDITVKEIIESIQGPYHLVKCIIDKDHCEKINYCPVRIILEKAESKMMEIFAQHTAADLIKWKTEKKAAQVSRR